MVLFLITTWSGGFEAGSLKETSKLGFGLDKKKREKVDVLSRLEACDLTIC